MAIKLIATDLDGTYLNEDHETISKRNIDAFKKAHEMGIKIVVASGRTKRLTDAVIEQIPFADYLITSNGAVTYNLSNGEKMFSELVNNKQAFEIFEIIKRFDLPYEIYHNGNCYIDKKNHEIYMSENIPPIFLKVLGGKLIVVDDLKDIMQNDDVEKINIMAVTKENRDELIKKIHEVGDIHTASAISSNMEINNVNANKGFAIKRLANILNIERNEIMAFGDGQNDCEMLEYAGYSFAMNNGSNYAKESAKYITDDNTNFGVAKAVEKYILG